MFLEQLANGVPQGGDELAWLLQATGKDLRALEQEFRDYMAKFPPQEAPWLEPLDASLRLIEELKSL